MLEMLSSMDLNFKDFERDLAFISQDLSSAVSSSFGSSVIKRLIANLSLDKVSLCLAMKEKRDSVTEDDSSLRSKGYSTARFLRFGNRFLSSRTRRLPTIKEPL